MLPLSRIGFGKLYKAPVAPPIIALNLPQGEVVDCVLIPKEWAKPIQDVLLPLKVKKVPLAIVSKANGETFVLTHDDAKLWRAIDTFSRSKKPNKQAIFDSAIATLKYNESVGATQLCQELLRQGCEFLPKAFFARLQQDATADLADGI